MKLEKVADKELNSKSKSASEICQGKSLSREPKNSKKQDSETSISKNEIRKDTASKSVGKKLSKCVGKDKSVSELGKKTTRSRKPRSKNTLTSIQDEFNFCFVCGEPGTEPPTEEWIQCGECSSWFHEQCANIEGGIFQCERCGFA